MKIHEYQAKELLAECGVTVPRGVTARQAHEVRAIAQELDGPVVVKAQIHAGGRGKGGGIRRAEDPDEAARVAGQILGMTLVTPQTGPGGRVVRTVLVEEACAIEREFYLGVVLDRQRECPVLMASAEGGMEIERVAAESPEKIFTAHAHPLLGLARFQARGLAYRLGLAGDQAKAVTRMILGLYTAFVRFDCSLVEINPLVLTGDGVIQALDAKINLDDNALGRQRVLQGFRDTNEEAPLETRASEHDLNYIKLDGNIGCMVNGAGLAMATMDLIQLAGAAPANFLDVGGAADSERVAAALEILLSDKNVEAVLINIFGGIVRCDRVAEGILAAAQKINITAPVVLRLEGTNAAQAAQLLADANVDFIVADGGLADAARRAVAAAQRK